MNILGADVLVATAISGSGQAAGYNIFDSNPNPIFRAFLGALLQQPTLTRGWLISMH